MAKTDKTETKKPTSKFKPLVMSEVTYVAVDQSAERTYTEFFTGPKADQRVNDYAANRALKLKRPVMIFGPQRAVVSPPSEPEAVVTEFQAPEG